VSSPDRFRFGHDRFLDDVTCSYLREFSEDRFDILLRQVEFRNPEVGKEVDIMLVDLDERYIEAKGVYLDAIEGRSNTNPEIGKVLRRLRDDWDYMYNVLTQEWSSIREVKPLDGNIYFDPDDSWKFSSQLFEKFSDEMFGYNPLERGYTVIDPADCGVI